MKTIHTAKAPEAIGPYSQAVKIGDLLFTSGQIAINPASGQVEADTIEGQTEQVMQNLAALLEEAGYEAASPEEARQIYGLRPRT